MYNNINNLNYIGRKKYHLLSASLVSSKHKAQFERYISTGNIEKNIAIELYDNLLFNMHLRINSIIVIIASMIGGFIWGRTGFFIILFTTMFLADIITYYLVRVIINSIYPEKYKNGSNKNFLFPIWNTKKRREIPEYIPRAPILKKIGIYNPWECPDCKELNLIEKRICFKCKFEHYWKCIDCETLNISENLTCIKCNIKKDYSENLRMNWKCNECNEENQNIFTICWKCNKEKI